MNKFSKTANKKNIEDMMYLLRCALKGEKAAETRLKEMDGQGVFRLAHNHNLLPLAYMALDHLDMKKYPLVKNFKEARDFHLLRELTMEPARNEVMKKLTEAGAANIPLKGAVLTSLYPVYGTRTMGDTDILIAEDKRDVARGVMEKLGYEEEEEGTACHHDSYAKEPFQFFELHHSLVHERSLTDLTIYNYYEKEKKNFLKNGMSPEDIYVFTLVHAYRHMHEWGNGFGLKLFLDVYVLLTNEKAPLNMEKVHGILKEIKLVGFEKTVRGITEKLLVSEGTIASLNAKERGLLEKLKYGAWGNGKEDVLRHIFPKTNYIRTYRPIYEKYPILIPVGYIHRLGVIMFRKQGYIKGKKLSNKKYKDNLL